MRWHGSRGVSVKGACTGALVGPGHPRDLLWQKGRTGQAGAVAEQPGQEPGPLRAGRAMQGRHTHRKPLSPLSLDLRVPPVDQTQLTTRAPVTQSMGPQSGASRSGLWVSVEQTMNSTVPRQQWDGMGLEEWKGLGTCLKYQQS